VYSALVHPHTKYANSVWSPHKQGDIVEIENIKKSNQAGN